MMDEEELLETLIELIDGMAEMGDDVPLAGVRYAAIMEMAKKLPSPKEITTILRSVVRKLEEYEMGRGP